MPNMSHCRFTNTLSDLRDCYNHLGEEDLSDAEFKAMLKLVEMCAQVVQATVGIGDSDFKNDLKEWIKNEEEMRQEMKEESAVS